MNELLQNPNHTKIDFHNHSTYSDGDHEIEKICELKYFLDVLCITNHFPDYPESFYRSKEFQTKYYKNKSENLPELIVGMEYRLENNNELLIFGEKAILNLVETIPKTDIELFEIVHQSPSVSIICHPIPWKKNCTDYALENVHGIEMTRSGVLLDEYTEKFEFLHRTSNLKLVTNSDFHSLRFPIEENRVEYHTFNIIKNVRIRNEDELIQAFDKKNKIEIVPQYHTYPEGLLKKYWMEQLGMI